MILLNSPVQVAVLDSLEAIEVMLDSRQRAAFLPFVNREVSVSQAALEVGELPNTMLYRVKRWQRLGLLLETCRVPHAKGSMRLYRSMADAFFIPHSATSSEDLLALAREVHLPIFTDFLASFVRSGEHLSADWGVRFESNGGHWSVRPAKSKDDLCEPADPEGPSSMAEYAQLQLSAAQAKALQLELWAVLERYVAQSSPQGKVYKVFLGLA